MLLNMGWKNVLIRILMFFAMYLSASQFLVREDLISRLFAGMYFLLSMVIGIVLLANSKKIKIEK